MTYLTDSLRQLAADSGITLLIVAANRIEELEKELLTRSLGDPQRAQTPVVTDEMVHAALREMSPALYGTYLRHPANGPALSAITENQIRLVRKMLEEGLRVQKS